MAAVDSAENSKRRISHVHSNNMFKLYSLPIPIAGQVVGLVGPNNIGKSTTLQIISAILKPNLGIHDSDSPPNEVDIFRYFQSPISKYFRFIYAHLGSVLKPQDLGQVLSHFGKSATVGEVIESLAEMGNEKEIIGCLDLASICDRSLGSLSLGELQRVSCAVACVQNCNVYAFDEPFSYLDMKQRLNAAKAIRSLIHPSKYILVAEHDLSVLEYLSDFIHCFYGSPGDYGVVSDPYTPHEGINVYLDGFLPTENVRIREDSFVLSVSTLGKEVKHFEQTGKYPNMTKSFEGFKLKVEASSFAGGEIIVLLGNKNGTGKSTFLHLLEGSIQPDEAQDEILTLKASCKPQNPRESITNTVRALLSSDIYTDPQFVAEYIKPLKIEEFIDKEEKDLSTSESQRLSLVLCMGKQADVYLIDEPSSHLDCEERLTVVKVIKRFIKHTRKTAFVVEHDFSVATYLADRVIVFGCPPASHETIAGAPQAVVPAMSRFLLGFDFCLGRLLNNYQLRIFGDNSVKDIER